MSDDHARPIPRQPSPKAPDDVYTVDTRDRRGRTTAPPPRPAPRAGTPPPPRTAAAADDGLYDQYGRRLPPGGTPPPPAPPGPPRALRPRRTGRRAVRVAVGLLVAWLAFLVVAPWHAWSTTSTVDAAPEGDRPGGGAGQNYLLVGSDSREGLTSEQKKTLGTGSAQGRRTDSILLVHTASVGGTAALISIPRDSFLPIPGNGQNKVNAAFAVGGPELLVQTLEQATGLRIDGYVEIGFGGFAGVVDSLGGVDICVPRDIKDAKAHIDLTKGCQTLQGPDALGYVRARYSDPKGDIGRAERQRQFLGAVMKQAATPSTVLIPWRWWDFTHSAASNVIVGEDTGLLDSARLLQALRGVSSGDTMSLVVPVADINATTSAGSSVLWDEAAAQTLFGALRDGTPLPEVPQGSGG